MLEADVFTRDELSNLRDDWSGIVPAAEYGYFTMDYVPTNLESYWKSYRNHLMPVSEAVLIIDQVCDGLAAAHGETPPILHRDIKPQNILIARSGFSLRAIITDFGLATRLNQLSLTASLRGTPVF